MKILVIKFRNIGDVLLTTPLLSNLKHNFPDAQIDIALNKGTEEMINLNPNVNDIIVYDREKIKSYKGIKRAFNELKFALDIKKRGYDMVINTTGGDRGAVLSFISGATTKIGYISKSIISKTFTHILPPQQRRHIIEANLDPLRVLNKEIKDKKVEIFWSKEDDKIIDELNLPKNFIHFHPVSRWLFKCIDDKISAKIIDYIENELETKVVITAAPVKKEFEKIESILKLTKSNPINLSGKLTLKQSAALSKRAKFFIGVDTAIMHISAANDTPVLAFFGPSGAFHWGPWDNELIQSGYEKQNGFQKMGKHRVLQLDWECIPCGKDGCNGTKISDCLIDMDIGFIVENIREMRENT